MFTEQFKKEQAALHEPGAFHNPTPNRNPTRSEEITITITIRSKRPRFMAPEQFQKEQAASHEPPVGRDRFHSVPGKDDDGRRRRSSCSDGDAVERVPTAFIVAEHVREDKAASHDLG